MKKEKAIDPKLERALADLQQIPPRDQTAEARGRANFLHQAAVMRTGLSRKPISHHDDRKSSLFSVFKGKGRMPALRPLAAIILAAIILFGGMTSTVLAAQESLPDQALYPLKTWSEDAILALPSSPQIQVDHLLDFSDRRVVEMSGLIDAGLTIPEMVLNRLLGEVDQMLELVASMDDPQMMQQLERIRMRLETQLELLNGLLETAPDPDLPILQQGCNRMREQLQLLAEGETDPQGFRMRMHEEQQNQTGSGEQNMGPGNGTQGPAGTSMPGMNGMQTPDETPNPGGMGNGSGSGSSSGQPGGNGGQNGGTPQNLDNGMGSGGGSGKKP